MTTIITEDYVSFGVAKMLEKHGFDTFCDKVWFVTKHGERNMLDTIMFVEGEIKANQQIIKQVLKESIRLYGGESEKEVYLCPTINMARKWLREIHNIDIVVNPYQEEKPTQYLGLCIKNEIYYDPCEYFEKYEDAAVSAIRYALKNLI